jgi:hypothetical protein
VRGFWSSSASLARSRCRGPRDHDGVDGLITMRGMRRIRPWFREMADAPAEAGEGNFVGFESPFRILKTKDLVLPARARIPGRFEELLGKMLGLLSTRSSR